MLPDGKITMNRLTVLFVLVIVLMVDTCSCLQCTALPSDDFNEALECPRPGGPSELSECCEEGTQCCAPSILKQMDETLVMAVALTVIVSCLSVTILVVVCCFWSRCPLYDTCRTVYTQEDVLACSEDEEAGLNPKVANEEKDQKLYSPMLVRIKPIADV